MVYFSVLVGLEWAALRSQEWLPSYMGGPGSLTLWEQRPHPDLDTIYAIQVALKIGVDDVLSPAPSSSLCATPFNPAGIPPAQPAVCHPQRGKGATGFMALWLGDKTDTANLRH